MDKWKDVKGYEGKYQVSNNGFVRSLNYNNTGKSKILKPKINKQGHLEVTLNKNNKHNYFMLNRLIIHTFTTLKLEKNDIVMYKDGNKQNCSLDNMYIISRGKRQELTYDREKRYRHKFEYYGEYLPIKEISKRIGYVTPEQIRKRLRLYWSIYECEIPVGRISKNDK